MSTHSIRTMERDKAVNSALDLIGACRDDNAADTYLPGRLRQTVRLAYQAGVRHRGGTVHAMREALERARFALDIPGTMRPDDRHEPADAHAGVICRKVLNMSDPPPNRHVAYFTGQLRRALAAAWEAGEAETQRHMDALRGDIAEALQAAPDNKQTALAASPQQRARQNAIANARKYLP